MLIKNYIKKNFVLIIPFLFFTSSFPIIENGIDLRTSKNTNETCNGYTIISTPDDQTILIDMDGRIIHNWSIKGHPSKMLPGGDLLGGDERNQIGENTYVSQEDWNGTIIWEFHDWENGSSREHHDVEREGNPVGYYAPGQDFIEKGRTLILSRTTIINKSISKWPLEDDVIYEVDWNGNLTSYRWYANEHFDEFGFDAFAKFGIYFQKFMYKGWLHVNSISELGKNQWYEKGDGRFKPDNIIISSRHANFIAIIERSSGKLVWKVGPDYSKKTPEGQKLGKIIGPHHAHMIPKGLPGEGNILIFDNGGFGGYRLLGLPIRNIRFYSRVIEFNPTTYDIVWEYQDRDGPLIPWFGKDPRFFSPLVSSAQRLPNGNTLICEGNRLRVFEVTPEKNVVWEYFCQYESGTHNIYRAYRVPPEWVPGNPSDYETWE